MDLNFIKRMPTGITGLDDMIEDGLPIPSITLVAGDAGAGKTAFCIQFPCKGADRGEHELYLLTFGGPHDLLFNFASSYEFVKRTYFEKEIYYVDLEDIIEKAERSNELLEAVEMQIDGVKPARIVMENLSVLEEVLKDEYRRILIKLSHLIKTKGLVALVAEDALPGAPYPIPIAQVADEIILLLNVEINLIRRRSIEIQKMCGTSHHLGKRAVDISVKGMVIYPGL